MELNMLGLNRYRKKIDKIKNAFLVKIQQIRNRMEFPQLDKWHIQKPIGNIIILSRDILMYFT